MMRHNTQCNRLTKSGFRPFPWVVLISILLCCLPSSLQAQEEPVFDEIEVMFNVPRIGGANIPALIRDQEVYLSVADVFTFLQLRNTPSPEMNSISGFIINPDDLFLIDKTRMIITYQKKTFPIKPDDLMGTGSYLYLKPIYFGEIFGLFCTFDFRSLSVTMNTKIELPVIREMRLEVMRNNINRLKGEVKVDSTIRRTYPLFKLGMFDWSVFSSQQSQGKATNRVNFSIGSALAGGTAEWDLNYQTGQSLGLKNQRYLWKYANNEHRIIRQVMAGKIATQTISSVNKPVVGLQFSNTPTTFRKAFGSYKLSDVTQPNWIVELYVNGVLVDYVKADASGLYSFDVPLVYGSSDVHLRFYGPWGEEQERKMNINIPFNFIPSKSLEYSVSAGMLEDSVHTKIAKAQFDYGLSSRLTVGGGFEYNSSIISGTNIPFINASFRLGSRILMSGEYSYGVQSKATLNYSLPATVDVDMEYTRYDKNQKALNQNYLEEKRLSLTLPFRSKNFSLFSKMSIHQIVMPSTTNTSAQWSLSAQILGISNNLTTYYMLSKQAVTKNSMTYSTLSQTFRLPARITYTQQLQYEYSQKEISRMEFRLDKPLFRQAYLNVHFEHDFKTNIYSMGMGFRMDFSFAQTAFSAQTDKNREYSFSESATGSFFYDGASHHMGANSRSSVNKGGIVIVPFLDINGDGTYQKGEPRVKSLKLRINGGRIQYDEHDTVVRISDLEPYVQYIVELSRSSFENIAWQMKNASLSITVDPNVMKTVEVPIYIAGEASGTVSLKEAQGLKGLGRITVQFLRANGTIANTTLTEGDGFFTYLGLKPGNYVARMDSAQMRKLRMVAAPTETPFTIKKSLDGDFVDGLDFTLKTIASPLLDTISNNLINKEAAPVPIPVPASMPVPAKSQKSDTQAPIVKTAPIAVKDVPNQRITTDSLIGYYFVQMGAYPNEEIAKKSLEKFSRSVPYHVILVFEKGLYKVRVGYFKTFNEANACHQWMRSQGFETFRGQIISGEPPIKYY